MSNAVEILDRCYRHNDTDPFKIVVKNTCTKEVARALLVMKKDDPEYPLNYSIDGLILVSNDLPYVCGRDWNLFKYKKTEDHTIDFLCKITTRENYFDLYVSEGKKLNKVCEIEVNKKTMEILGITSPILLNNTIVESSWCAMISKWNPIKMRLDKKLPNNITTLNRTLTTIRCDVTPKELCMHL